MSCNFKIVLIFFEFCIKLCLMMAQDLPPFQYSLPYMNYLLFFSLLARNVAFFFLSSISSSKMIEGNFWMITIKEDF